ncbi:MAG: type II secretion system F family protein [Candidatus Omnitrophota bacterium]
MAKFLYKAKKNPQDTIQGMLEESSREAAIEKLFKMGLTPVEVLEELPAAKPSVTKIKSRRISRQALVVFTHQLHTLIKSGVELLSCLRILQEQESNLQFKAVLVDLFETVKDGASFSQSLARHPAVFPRVYVNMIIAGEASGNLQTSLKQLCVYLDRIEDLRLKLRQALAYPILMIGVGLISIFVLLTFVIPRLSQMFSDLDIKLPLPTQVLLWTGNFMKNWWWLAIAVLIIGIYLISLLAAKKGGGWILQMRFRLPIVKRLFYKQAMVNFTTALGLLLKSGVPLFEALSVATALLEEKAMIKELEAAREQVKVGVSLSQSLSSAKFFSPFLVQMIRVGEEGGRLEEVISEISLTYSQALESDLKIVSSLIEPLIILILGVAIGAIVISMLLPIFQINVMVS